MFTGIIESLGKVVRTERAGANLNILVQSAISGELRVDQSVNHNGACLTVTRLESGSHWVTAVKETIEKSNIGVLKAGDTINLERSMPASGRFDGHIVQGHVDTKAEIKSIIDENGSWRFDFSHPENHVFITVEKGSVCINGISLTCFNCTRQSFSTAIIPFTFEHTNLGSLRAGDTVNIEFDVLGKYIERILGSR